MLNLNEDAAAQDGKRLKNSMKVGDKAAFNVDGPIKVEHRNAGAHSDGIHYHVIWEPLDDQGNVMQQISNRPSGAPTFTTWVPPFNLDWDQVFEPPFNNPNGWRVRIHIPAQASSGGNVPGVVLDINELPRPSKE